MEGVLHTALLTTTIILSSIQPQASTSATFSPLPTIGQESFHVVKEGDTLKKIADEVYNSEEAVDLIVKDNQWIQNPDYIETGWHLKVRKNPLTKKALVTPQVSTSGMLVKANDETKITPQVQSATAFASNAPTTVAAQSTIQQITPTVVQQASYTTAGPLNEAQIQFLGSCEAGMDPAKNTGNGYYGAFQFSYGTWKSMGTGYERADLAPLEVQIDAVQRLLSRSSIYTQFPGCARKMQSLGMI